MPRSGHPSDYVPALAKYGGIDDVASRKRAAKANWRWLYELYLPPNPSMDQHSWEGTKWLDLMVEVDERDYFVRTKKRLSGFYPTDLEFLLRNLDVDNVVLTPIRSKSR
jgi:nicotinamidase-related amidase